MLRPSPSPICQGMHRAMRRGVCDPSVDQTRNRMEEHRSSGTMIPQGNGEKILVVDDDEVLRSFYAEALCRCGYRVTLSENGMAALDVFRKAFDEGRTFDLVVMDMCMPGMDGAVCAESLFQINRDANILLVSGNLTLDLGDLSERLVGVMSKPMGLRAFLLAVRDGVIGERVPQRPPL